MRKKYLVILSLFIAMILCFTAPAVALADSVVVNPGSGGNVTVIVPTNPGDGTSTIVTVTEDEPVIGDIVSFAGHEWYVIGTDSEGVIAPEGCYTLFAKNNEFGSTAFRSGMSNKDISIVYYKDSDLKKAMDNIANGFSSADIANIVPRATLDGIWGDAVTDQLLWPIAWEEEGVNIATSISYYIILIGFILQLMDMIYLGIALTFLGLLFQIVTLPVEFDASKRANLKLAEYGLCEESDLKGTKAILKAAAMTYVAGVLASALQIIRLILAADRRN